MVVTDWPCAEGYGSGGDSLSDNKVPTESGDVAVDWPALGRLARPNYPTGPDSLDIPRNYAQGGCDWLLINGGGSFFPQIHASLFGVDFGLANAVDRHECRVLNLLCGSNNASPALPVLSYNPTSYYAQLYNGTTPITAVSWPTDPKPTYPSPEAYADALLSIVRGHILTLLAHGCPLITLCSAPDHSLTPNIQSIIEYGDLSKRRRVRAWLDYFNAGIEQVCEEFQLVFVDVARLFDDLFGMDGGLKTVWHFGGNAIALRQYDASVSGNLCGFTDAVHPNWPIVRELLNTLWNAANVGGGCKFELVSEEETCVIAGIPYFSDTVEIDYSNYCKPKKGRSGWWAHRSYHPVSWFSPVWWVPTDVYAGGVCVGGQRLRGGAVAGQRLASGAVGGGRLRSGATKGQVIYG